MKISSCVLTGAWPIYSCSRRGRMARSTASSSVLAVPLMMRSAVTLGVRLPRRALERPANEFLGGMCTGTDRFEQARGLRGSVAERDQSVIRLSLGVRAGARRRRAASRRGYSEPVAHLHDQPLGGLATHPRNACQGGDVLALHAFGERRDADAREQRQGDLRPYSRHLDEAAKQPPLLLGRKRIEHMGILAHYEVCEQA